MIMFVDSSKIRSLNGFGFCSKKPKSPTCSQRFPSREPHSITTVPWESVVTIQLWAALPWDERPLTHETSITTMSVSGRGVFSSNMVQYYWGSGTFFSRFGALIPGYGTPVGTHPEDTVVLSQGFDRTSPSNSATANARFDDIWSAIDAWSRLISVVATHEIGHAIGLCTNGHPLWGSSVASRVPISRATSPPLITSTLQETTSCLQHWD